jgi:hypothetical protein
MTFRHETLLGTTCVGESTALDLGSVLENKRASDYTVRVEGTIKEVETGDAL